MQKNRILVKNVWYTVFDTVLSPMEPRKVVSSQNPIVTHYLATDEKDNVCLILPYDIEVIETLSTSK